MPPLDNVITLAKVITLAGGQLLCFANIKLLALPAGLPAVDRSEAPLLFWGASSGASRCKPAWMADG